MTDISPSARPPVAIDGIDGDATDLTRPEWDAYAVWRDRVKKTGRQQAAGPQHLALTPPPAWDPYFVWLSRVKKTRD